MNVIIVQIPTKYWMVDILVDQHDNEIYQYVYVITEKQRLRCCPLVPSVVADLIVAYVWMEIGYVYNFNPVTTTPS